MHGLPDVNASATGMPAPDAPPDGTVQVDLWDLAQRATILCSGSAPVELVEATATLQELGCRLAGSDTAVEQRRTWLRSIVKTWVAEFAFRQTDLYLL